ncbi:DUF6290 family protein [Succinatimonas hippei]|uniref:type II toxin-antitoxin system RelB family antitoxin n=1 Tax=Succinatimonas hippei TaxID=626938 RepID=UPI002012607A|nr:DUF6290 family protein [Succinatimonas hippei]MCL1602455.1 DUF6290 family protein [Succinatimonas hippei]
MSFSIRLTDAEKSLAQAYADMHSISLSEAFKRALFEKIEDEYDAKIAEEAYAEYLKDPETVSHEDAGKILGL